MPDVVVAMELTDEFNEFGFFASTESAEYIQQGREGKKPAQKPRLGRMWSFRSGTPVRFFPGMGVVC